MFFKEVQNLERILTGIILCILKNEVTCSLGLFIQNNSDCDFRMIKTRLRSVSGMHNFRTQSHRAYGGGGGRVKK